MSGASNSKMSNNARKRSNDEDDYHFPGHLMTDYSVSTTSSVSLHDIKKYGNKK